MNSHSEWFEMTELASGITRFREPDVHRFFRANLYHVVGRDADIVIDFGTGVRSLRSSLGTPGSKPLIAVATHVHVDHVGSFHEFGHRLGHAAEAAAFASMADADTLADIFREHPDAVSRAPHAGWEPRNYRIQPAPLTQALSDGDRIDIGDASYRVLHLPGHSPGSIGLLEESRGILFSGDAIYDGTLVDDLPGCDRKDYRATMETLRRLEVTTAFGGHGEPMSRKRMHAIASNYLDSTP